MFLAFIYVIPGILEWPTRPVEVVTWSVFKHTQVADLLATMKSRQEIAAPLKVELN